MTLDISAIRQRIENYDGDNFSWLDVVEELCGEVERLREDLTERDGIIRGLMDVAEGKTKSLAQIKKELKGQYPRPPA